MRNSYKFASSVLERKRSGKLEKPGEEVETYPRETHSFKMRDEPLGRNSMIEAVPPPKKHLDDKEPTWKEIKEVLKKARAGSAPGPNSVTYKVYKKFPKRLNKLWKIIRVI